MNREDEICLALQGLINGVDYESGEVVEFGTRDDFKNMRGRQFGVNVQNKG
jgi:hypothetical protein